MNARKTVVEILMKREMVSEDEAKEMLNDTIDAVMDCIACGDYLLAEEIFMGDLGLEPDYLLDLLIA